MYDPPGHSKFSLKQDGPWHHSYSDLYFPVMV